MVNTGFGGQRTGGGNQILVEGGPITIPQERLGGELIATTKRRRGKAVEWEKRWKVTKRKFVFKHNVKNWPKRKRRWIVGPRSGRQGGGINEKRGRRNRSLKPNQIRNQAKGITCREGVLSG